GGQRPDLGRLIGEHFELVADEGRLKLDDLGEVLGAGKALGEVEAGVEIALSNVDELAVEGGRALACGVEGTLERIDGLFKSILALLVGFAGLCDGLLGESTYALRHSRLERELLELLGALAEGFARLVGGVLRRIGCVHAFSSRL